MTDPKPPDEELPPGERPTDAPPAGEPSRIEPPAGKPSPTEPDEEEPPPAKPPEEPPPEDVPPDEAIDRTADSGSRKPPIDLRDPAPPGQALLIEAPPYSPEWAKILWPITRGLLTLIATVMLLPFLIIVLATQTQAASALDWAKTVLPPVVGFGGAIVGYYFGTRGASHIQPSQDDEAE